MTETNPRNQQKYCSSCGAPVVSEICAYCGTATGLNTAEADMVYPVLECKEATLNFWTVCFPMIFAAAFGIPGAFMLIVAATGFGNGVMFLVGTPFFLIGIAAFVLMLRPILRYAKVQKNGKTMQATVYGYLNDQVLINDCPAQIVKLLVQTPNGPRFILYQLGNTLKPYGINEKIDIKVYQDCFMICKRKNVSRW